MVAPVQGSIGKSSTAPETQDYLNELTNFYNKPENEGVKSEFVAPDGSKFEIKDASYLSTVKSNVNTGKLKGTEEFGNKAVSKNADTEIGSYAADKKAKADKQSKNDPAQQKQSEGKSKMAQGKDFVQNGKKPVEELQNQQPGIEGQIKAKQAETVKIQGENKKAFEQMEANNKELGSITKQITEKTKQKFQKAAKVRRAQMAAKAAKAAEAAEADSTTQSGAKMGFEGKLMTTAGASSGNAGNDAAMQKAWEDTMNGKINVSVKSIQAEQPKLANVKEAGEKAAQPLLDQASGSDKAADGAADARKDGNVNGGINIGGDVLGIVVGIVQCVTAGTNVAAWVSGIAAILVGVVKGIVDGVNTNKNAKRQDDQIDNFNAQADDQRTQAMVARKNAIAQTQASNAKIIQATQNLNKVSQELSEGLSSSEMPAFNTDGMDEAQLETVKQARYDQIMEHEMTHASIIGGTPVIETDANGVAIGGYVEIEVPSVNEADLEGTIEKAQRVIDAALAPSNPSSQDQSVASRAKDVLSKAQDLMEEKTEKQEKPEENKSEEKTQETKANEVKPELQTKAA